MYFIKYSERDGWVKLWILAIVAGLFVTGCRTGLKDDDELVMIPRIYLETGAQATPRRSVPIRLPLSGVDVLIDPLPVFVEADMIRVDLVEVEVGFGYAFSFKPDAARALYLLSLENQGRRLILFVNGKAIGARVVDGVMSDGILVVVPELSDEELINSINLIEDGIRRASK